MFARQMRVQIGQGYIPGFPAVPLALHVDVPRGAEDVDAFAVRALATTYDLAAPVAVVFGSEARARAAADRRR